MNKALVSANRIKSTEVTIMETRKRPVKIREVRYLGQGKFLVLSEDSSCMSTRDFGL